MVDFVYVGTHQDFSTRSVLINGVPDKKMDLFTVRLLSLSIHQN